MAKKAEIEFSRDFRFALESRGAIVTKIEAAIGSTPGVPDFLVSMVGGEMWAELKDSDVIPTGATVWSGMLRPTQRRWIRQRHALMNEKTPVPVYVFVRHELGVWIYVYSMLRGPLKKVGTALSVEEAVDYVEAICG